MNQKPEGNTKLAERRATYIDELCQKIDSGTQDLMTNARWLSGLDNTVVSIATVNSWIDRLRVITDSLCAIEYTEEKAEEGQ